MKRFRWLALVAGAGLIPGYSQALFQPHIDYTFAGASVTAVADFNGDGLPDIAVGGTNRLTVLLQNANAPGTFTAASATILNAGTGTITVVSMAAGDFNTDGKQDLLVVLNNPGVSASASIALFGGNGNGTFFILSGNIATGTPGTFAALVPGNFNPSRDANLDFAVRAGDLYTVYLGDGSGRFTIADVQVCSGSGSSLDSADFNHDGKADLVCGSNVFLGNGDGTFTQTQVALDGFGLYGTTADLNSDGRPDIVELNYRGLGPEVWLGQGDGSFQAPLNTTFSITPVGAGVADLNADGLPDFVALSGDGSSSTLYILLGQGNGQFQTPPITLPTCVASPFFSLSNAITIADLNRDGAPDVIVSCGVSNTVSVFLGVTRSFFFQTSANPSQPSQNVQLTASVLSVSVGAVNTNGLQVQFYDGSHTLGAPVRFGPSSQAVLATSFTPGIHYLKAVLQNAAGGVAATSIVVPQVVAPASCAVNVNAQLNIAPGGFRRNPATGQFTQTVTVANTSQSAIAGPLSLALANLPDGVTALNPGGFTACTPPADTPLVDLGVCPGGTLAPGQSTTFTLAFSDPQNKTITYTPLALAGYAPR